MTVRVFAYGANMCSAYLRGRYSVTPEAPGQPVVLRGYRLLFNKRSTKDNSGKANVEPATAHVCGVLYLIPKSQLENLDEREGGYKRWPMAVDPRDRDGGGAVEAWVYLANRVTPDLRPFTWYRDFLVLGAKEHGLPAAYIADLEAIEADSDPDPEREAKKRKLMRCTP